MKKELTAALALGLGLFLTNGASAQSGNPWTLKASTTTTPIPATMWGIFFEDINFAADGGIYAEMVKNRSFEFNSPLTGWKVPANTEHNGTILTINRKTEDSANPRFIRVALTTPGQPFTIRNDGFRGMGIRKDEQYNFSVWANPATGTALNIHVELLNAQGASLGSTDINPSGTGWQQYKSSLTASATEPKGSLQITFTGNGSIDLDMVSLFPQHTWKERPNGMRADLVQLLADMKPGFLRFPGGCIVEGRELATRYQWKKTVGNVENRQLIINRWNTEFAHRLTPDYYQSFGLGFFEYFQLAEDIGASPLPIINCGMACQFNTSEVVATPELDPYIQDALDLIEFANGSTTTKWGALRAAMGHPAPFNLKMMGVGNEQWGPQYIERFTFFAKAIKQKYPDVRLVNSLGPDPDGARFTFLNDTLRKMNADILDEHYYRSPEWFLQQAQRYDHYDRKGPKIFAGEYAAQSGPIASPNNENNWQCALSEAAFMTGLERNADVVQMASYAPLFAHADAWQWTPDLIWFDNLRSYGTTNYYVQKLYSNYKGTDVVSLLNNGQVIAGQDSLFASSVIDHNKHTLILKLVNVSDQPRTQTINVEGVKQLKPGTITVLKGEALRQMNSFDRPMAVSPVEQPFATKGKKIAVNLAPHSFTVVSVGI